MSEWKAEASDDEWEVYNTKETIPMRLAVLFKEIEEKKVLPISVKCPRKGLIKESLPNTPQLSQPIKPPLAVTTTPDQKETKQQIINPNFEAFEFNSEETDELALQRKTPSSVKRVNKPEKVSSSLSNVMNDLRRSKMLDELEKKEEQK